MEGLVVLLIDICQTVDSLGYFVGSIPRGTGPYERERIRGYLIPKVTKVLRIVRRYLSVGGEKKKGKETTELQQQTQQRHTLASFEFSKQDNCPEEGKGAKGDCPVGCLYVFSPPKARRVQKSLPGTLLGSPAGQPVSAISSPRRIA